MSVEGEGDQSNKPKAKKASVKKAAAKKAAGEKPAAETSASDDAPVKPVSSPAPQLSSGPTPPTLSAVPTPPKVAAREPRRQPYRSEPKLPVNPRRVRGGVKLAAKEGEQLNSDELHLRTFWRRWNTMMTGDAASAASAEAAE